jgi:O-antigen ligase
MTVVADRPAGRRVSLPPLREPAGSRWPLAILLAGFGLLFTAAGLALRGSTWILPDGLLGGGIALVVCAPLARSMLEPLVVSSPFMFYTLSPVGGILTVGSSDALLPVFVFLILAGAAVARGRRPLVVRPPVPAAMPLIVLTLLLCTASTVLWTVLSPDFLAARSIADTIKLAAGVGYLIVVFVLVRRVGLEGALRSFRLWGWTATALSSGSLAGITGAVEIIPSDGYRSLGYFQDANLYAGYLLVSLSVLIFLGTMPTPDVSSRWLPVQAVLILGGIVTTGSRGGMLSLALLVAFATLIINSARLRLMVLAGTAVVTAAGYWLLANRDQGVTVLGLDRLFFASKSQAVEDDPRVALWVRAVEKWLDAPIWGIGAGQFERFSGDVFRVAKSSGLGYVTHNSFLFFLVSFGVLGFGLFLYLLWWIVRDLYRAPHLSRNAKHALASGIVVILSQMMTLNLQNLRYVWIYFGLVLGVAMLERGERRGQQRP